MDIHNRPKLLYPSMVIAAIAVTVFSLLGIATLTGALPYAHSSTSTGYGIDEVAGTENMGSENRKARTSDAAPACANCGVVESVRAVEAKGQASGVGALAGGVAGALLGNGVGRGNGRTVATLAGAAGGAFAGNEIEKSTKKHTRYRIRVRMGDDSIRTLYQQEAPGFSAGNRVKIVGGTVVLQS